MHSNSEEKVLLITFDEEGREELLRDIEKVIKEQDHEFGTLGDRLTPDEPRGGDWKLNDFYNIVWKEEENAPLHVDDSVIISGGKAALSDLYNRIRLLPAGCRQIELAAEPSNARPRRLRFSWLLGGIFCFFFLIPTADRFFVSSFSGKDHYWYQMWCYLVCALAVLPMPRLITLRSIWATRLNAILGLLCVLALMLLNLKAFGSPSHYFFIPPVVCHTLLCLFAATFATTALCAFFRRGLRRATPTEKARLQQSRRLLLLLLINIGFALVLVLGALMHAIHAVEGRSQPSVWHHFIIYTMFIAALVQPLWLLAEILPAGHRQKFCYLVTGIFLIPGLLTAAPVYLLELNLLSVESYALRISIALFIIAAAASVFAYLRQQIARK